VTLGDRNDRIAALCAVVRRDRAVPGVDLDEDKQAAALVIMRPGAGAQDRQGEGLPAGPGRVSLA
jgi:hypothetical protein